MSFRTFAARGLSFAHLASLSSRASKAEDDEDNQDARAEGDSDDEEDNTDRNRDDGDAKKGKAKAKSKARAEDDDDDDDDQDDDGRKSGKRAKAEDGDETKDYAEDDDDDQDDDDSQPSGKRAEEDDDDEDEEMRGKSAIARARRREQARCAAIMGCKAAGRNIELAANLAFNTRMGRHEAIAILKGTPGKSAIGDRQQRTARNPQLGAGSEMYRNPRREAAAGWDRAFSKVTGKRA
jgi:hypothetical protein